MEFKLYIITHTVDYRLQQHYFNKKINKKLANESGTSSHGPTPQSKNTVKGVVVSLRHTKCVYNLPIKEYNKIKLAYRV